MVSGLRSIVIREFSRPAVQEFYKKKAEAGLWDAEKSFLQKYFTKKHARVLDIGCGTGRTTISLYQMGFKVTGVDLVPTMIKTAKQISKQKKLSILYQVADAVQLYFADNSFEYALFSNQGWTQIPGKGNRRKALQEVHRILKPQGIFIFTAHQRVLFSRNAFVWLWQAFRFYFLKPLGFPVLEQNFGDRFFTETKEGGEKKEKIFQQQYIHVPSVSEVTKDIAQAGFTLLEVNGKLQISKKDFRKHPPVFFICQKRKP